jgi:hypothetical protein
MIVKVVNSKGYTIMQVDNLQDMFTPDQVHQIASQGFFFVVNEMVVAPDEVIPKATEAYFREAQARLNNNVE